jgi:hypothetical protein
VTREVEESGATSLTQVKKELPEEEEYEAAKTPDKITTESGYDNNSDHHDGTSKAIDGGSSARNSGSNRSSNDICSAILWSDVMRA